MNPALRFIGLAIFAWVGVRAASLTLLPGMTALAPEARAAPTNAPLLPEVRVSTPNSGEAVPSAPEQPYPYGYTPPGYGYPPSAYGYPPPGYGYPPPGYGYARASAYGLRSARPQTIVVPIAWPGGAPPPIRPAAASAWDLVVPPPAPLERFPEFERTSFISVPQALPRAPAASTPAEAAPAKPRLDRLQLTSWALLRNGLGNQAIAQGGTLGGSQVGARLTYKFTPAIAASLRFSSSAGGVRGAEAAAGIRWQPFQAVPVALNLERRQRLGRWGGRSDFAAFVEGGLYQRPVALGFALDAYAQAGWVGVKKGDWFADGSLTLTRPLWRNLSAGVGVWAGGQSQGQDSLYRIDAGPRLSYAVRPNLRVHLDYRQRLSGDALPRSGPALTVAGDF